MRNFGPYHFMLNREPECPTCRLQLIPVSTTFYRGIAFCTQCEEVLKENVLLKVVESRDNYRMRPFWSVSQGLNFFTPPPHLPSRLAAHVLLLWLSGEHDGRTNAIHDGRSPVPRTHNAT